SLFAFRVVAHEDLAESRVESFDMRSEVLTVLKLELFLPALFGRTRRRETVCRGIAQDSRAKLFVNEDAGLLLRDSGIERGLKTVVDHFLRGGNFLGLRIGQGLVPPEHLDLE